jgi:biotin carboxyl carrier protein
MIYKVKINNTLYEVDVIDSNSRPIIATIGNAVYEVWPQDDKVLSKDDINGQVPIISRSVEGQNKYSITKIPFSNDILKVFAPIPGIVLSIKVNIGDNVEIGDEICVLEAMKMKNVLRAVRSGKICKINVIPGQQVQHREVLVEFEE